MSGSNGTIVTFYSYKGGTGRTMAVANVAWILAMNGKRVLTVDWDLESPGLHKYFRPFLDLDPVTSNDGLIEMINHYSIAMLGGADPQRHEVLLAKHANVETHAVSLDFPFPDSGTVDLLTAGRQNLDYSTLITRDWDHFYSELGGGQFFDALREDMRDKYDYVLLDSRTGLSDVADICTIHLPDVLVDCFTLSEQSIEGAAWVARKIDGRFQSREIRILPVPMRIEFAENAKVEAGRAAVRKAFEGFPRGLDPKAASKYWLDVEIPYRPFFAFEETLAAFGEPAGSPTSILAAFERLTSIITDGTVTASPALEDRVRLALLDRFARKATTVPSELLVAYLSDDRCWADWIEQVLNRSGFRVRTHCVDASHAEELDARISQVGRSVLIYSPAFSQSSWSKDTVGALTNAALVGIHQQLTTVRIGEARLPTALQNPLDLGTMEEAQAVERLLDVLDRPLPDTEDLLSGSRSETRFPGSRKSDPTIWNVGPRNVTFTGRGSALEQLRDQLLRRGQSVVVPQALYGLGGVGKTHVALEYAHRFRTDYDVVWWISAEFKDRVNSSLAELAGKLGIAVGESVAEAAAAAREALRLGTPYKRWLLIFDNADDPAELQDDLPENGHVLITSRNQNWAQIAASLEIDVFTSDESIAHLKRKVPAITDREALEVSESLGYLPLAVEQAGAWMSSTGIAASDYLQQLEDQTAQALSLAPTNFPVVVAKTWSLSFNRLTESSPAAIRMLQLCAFFAPEPISTKMIYSDEMARLLSAYDPTLREKQMVAKVVQELNRFALAKVNYGDNTVQVHRLVQAVVSAQMTPEERDAACHDVHRILRGAKPSQEGMDMPTDDPSSWPMFEQILPHLVPSRAAECTEEETRQLLIDLVRYLWRRGEFVRAHALGQSMADLWTESFGEDDQQLLYLRFQMNNALRSLGKFETAYESDRDVYERQMRQDRIGPDHSHTLMTAGGLGADLIGLGRFQEALELFQQTYQNRKNSFGEDYPLTLSAANNVALVRRFLGEYYEALDMDTETLARRRTVLGDNHPLTLSSAENLGRDLRDCGRYRESVEELRRTHAAIVEVLAVSSNEALRTAKSLAVSLRKLGEYEEAKQLMEETLRSYELSFPSSPDRPSTELALASCHASLDDYQTAKTIARGIHETQTRNLGPEHPFTLATGTNLVAFQRATDELDQAIVLGRSTLEGLTTRLGADHPYTLSCAVNLANALADKGELAEASALESSTLSRLRQVLAHDHPDTLICEANHTVTLRQLGRTSESMERRDEVLGALRTVLGQGHPILDHARAHRRIDGDIEFQPL
ncbi:FxSxx-COOH system tetratricopeptide repeat protein [Actinocorallia libanotica]|uniref:Cellulose biosynthesis protein BcsQ n=1 Tax=Actinocorallia libanotica TaxID=46162 RepID=A0ABN1Q7R1_9ACTN